MCVMCLHVCLTASVRERVRRYALIKIDGINQSMGQLATDEWVEGVSCCVLRCSSVSGVWVNIVIVHLSLHVDTGPGELRYAALRGKLPTIHHSQTG